MLYFKMNKIRKWQSSFKKKKKKKKKFIARAFSIYIDDVIGLVKLFLLLNYYLVF